MAGWDHYNAIPFPINNGPSEAVNQVVSTMNYLQGQATSFTTQAMQILQSLENIVIPDVGLVPDVTLPRTDAELEWAEPQGLNIELGDLSSTFPADPGTPSISPNFVFTAPTFAPPLASISMPDRPASIDTSGVPERPTVGEVVIPATPSISIPVLESLETVTVPVFVYPMLPAFDGEAPEFTDAEPNVLINWSEPAYASENFDQVKAQITRYFAGGTGLPPAIEQAMFDRARSRLDITARKATADAFDTFANKGFTMPPGMLVEQVNAALAQNQLESNAQERDLRILVSQTEIDNMKFAVQQGLAAENILFNIFNNAAQRSFEVAKFTVEMQISLYNTKVTLFNALTSAYQTSAQVYKIKLDGALAVLDVYRLQLEGQKLVGELNLQKVQAYNARVQAVVAQVDVYRAQMQGAQVQADVVRAQLEGYRTDVQAFAERIGAEKIKFDAYKTEVEGEVAKLGMYDSQARVFQSLVAAEGVKADVAMKGVQADIERMNATTQRFTALVDRGKADVQAKLGVVEAKARTQGLNIQFMSAQNDASRAKAEAAIRVGEQQLQTNLGLVQALIERFKANVNAVLQTADLKARSLQAAGQMASTLAGGAMAAQNVQASIGANSGESRTVGLQYQESGSEQWNYQIDATPSE